MPYQDIAIAKAPATPSTSPPKQEGKGKWSAPRPPAVILSPEGKEGPATQLGSRYGVPN